MKLGSMPRVGIGVDKDKLKVELKVRIMKDLLKEIKKEEILGALEEG